MTRTKPDSQPVAAAAPQPQVRVQFHEQLAQLQAKTLSGLDLVLEQLDRTLEALHHQDVALAQIVIADDDRVDGRYLEVHQEILSLLARQSPVAGDLRLVASLLHVIMHVERMGDQCVNVCKLIPLSGHEPPVALELLELLEQMGSRVRMAVAQCKAAFEQRDLPLAIGLIAQDGEIDRLNRAIFRTALEVGDDPEKREWATYMVLVGRALERIADNAVDIGEQVAFVVTGLFEEFSDSHRPAIRMGKQA
jgi:phosphate transport system protein